MQSIVMTIETPSRSAVLDLTRYAADFVRDLEDGLLSVFVPHATAGVAIIEVGAGSDVDLLDAIDAVLSPDHPWRHVHGSHGHGADHVLPAFISPSLTVPVIAGEMQLGRWQSVVLVDPNGDNQTRSVRFSFLD